MYCEKCGAKIIDKNEVVCPLCSGKLRKSPEESTNACQNTNKRFNNNQDNEKRFYPSFILGLLASLFGISGGLCMSMCASLYSSGVAPFILILGGSVLGLIGACKCLKNARKGSLMQLIAAVMIIICAYGITGADFSTIIAMVLFIISGIIGLIYSGKKAR